MFTQKHKLIAVFVSVIIATALITSIAIYATSSPTSVFTLSPGIYPGTPTYTVWNESTNYYAKDQNGILQFSGSDASTVIQAAINALPSWTYGVEGGGGVVYLKAGTYLLATTLTLSTLQCLVGEGKYNTVLSWIGSAGQSMITIAGNDVKVSNMELNASSLAGYGIYLNKLTSPSYGGEVLSDIFVLFSTINGIYLNNTDRPELSRVLITPLPYNSKGIYITNGFYPLVLDCNVGVSNYSLEIDYSNVPTIIGGGYAGVMQFYRDNGGSMTGVDLETDGSLNAPYALMIGGENTYAPFTVQSTIICNYNPSASVDLRVYSGIQVNTIGDWFYGTNIQYDISIAGGSYAYVSGSIFKTKAFNLPASIYFYHNPGFVTENTGTATITGATSIVVSHGLSVTPTIVLITPTSSEAVNYTYYVGTVTTTQFTITVSLSGTYTFYWYAKYGS